MSSNSYDDDFFVSFEGLEKLGIRYCRPHIRRLVKAGAFPPAFRLSANRVAWKMGDLRAWKAARVRCPVDGLEPQGISK